MSQLRYAMGMALAVSGCAWLGSTQGKQVEQDALQLSQVLCVLANAELDSPTIAETCAIEKALLPEIEKLLAAHKAAMKREHVAVCAQLDKSDPWAGAKDAGTDAAFDGAQLGTRK